MAKIKWYVVFFISKFHISFVAKVNFTNTLGKGMNPIILPPAMGK